MRDPSVIVKSVVLKHWSNMKKKLNYSEKSRRTRITSNMKIYKTENTIKNNSN